MKLYFTLHLQKSRTVLDPLYSRFIMSGGPELSYEAVLKWLEAVRLFLLEHIETTNNGVT